MLSAKVSTKNQISLPSEARRRLGIEPGDRLTVEVVDDALVLRVRPARASQRLRGMGSGLYGDPAAYLRSLRDEWEVGERDRGEPVAGETARETPPDRHR